MPYVYEKTYSSLHSLFVFQMQKKQKERLGRHCNTEVTFCAIVYVLLFFSYCLVRIKNEIKTMLMTREGQSLCWDRWLFERKHAYLCTLPHWLEEKLCCLLSPYPSQKATFNFLLETYEISYCKPFPPNTAPQLEKLLPNRSNWSMLVQNTNRIDGWQLHAVKQRQLICDLHLS